MPQQTIKQVLFKRIFLDADVERFYHAVRRLTLLSPRQHPLDTINYILRLNWAQYRQSELYDVRLPNHIVGPIDPNQLRHLMFQVLRSDDSTRLPYLQGSESELAQRTPITRFVMDLLQYDVVSFDIFDTLILRPFSNPKDLFMLVGKRLNRTEFKRIRENAEARARENAKHLKGSGEITLYDIYNIIEERTGIPCKLGAETEFNVELDYCFANPYMKRVFRLLREHDKTIIITSDMYLPHDLMSNLLRENGYDGYDKLYVSCDYGYNKRGGSLYRHILKDYPGKTIIHIGDNEDSDIRAAAKAGIESKLYANCHTLGSPYRADGQSLLVGSAYAGIINTHLHNGLKRYSPFYEYGFIYGGLYILGFCSWIHNKALNENIEKIIFLSRDGSIYQRVFNSLYQDIPNEYFLWSRIANLKYTMAHNREDFLHRMVTYRSLSAVTITIGSLLESLNLSALQEHLSEYGLSENTLVVPENVKALDRFFINHWADAIEALKEEKLHIVDYLLNKIGDAKKIAVIDVGWLGSGPLGIKYLIEEELKTGCEVKCWLAGARPPADSDIECDLMDGTIEAYIFSHMMNRNLFDTHKNTNKKQNNIFFEMFSQAEYPTFSGFDSSGNFQFDIPEVENYSHIREIQQGIIDFCDSYASFFSRDPSVMNISGYDAYCPFRMIIRDLEFFKTFFGDFTFARSVGGDIENQRLETVSELLALEGL